MTTTLKLIQDDAEKLVRQNETLESRAKLLDTQIQGKRVELRKLEEGISAASEKKNTVEESVSKERREFLDVLENRNVESEKTSKAVARDRSVLVGECRAFEDEKANFKKEKEDILKRESAILVKLAKVKDIIG